VTEIAETDVSFIEVKCAAFEELEKNPRENEVGERRLAGGHEN